MRAHAVSMHAAGLAFSCACLRHGQAVKLIHVAPPHLSQKEVCARMRSTISHGRCGAEC